MQLLFLKGKETKRAKVDDAVDFGDDDFEEDFPDFEAKDNKETASAEEVVNMILYQRALYVSQRNIQNKGKDLQNSSNIGR